MKDRFINAVAALKKRRPELTNSRIAEKTDVSPQNFSNYLNPNRPIPGEYIERFVKEFSVRTEYLETGNLPIFTYEKGGENVSGNDVTVTELLHQLELLKKELEGKERELRSANSTIKSHEETIADLRADKKWLLEQLGQEAKKRDQRLEDGGSSIPTRRH